MAMQFSRKYKIRNPYKPDETVSQEVLISDSLQYDYSSCAWVAIDTEFLNLNIDHDTLCLVQLASPSPEDPEQLRVELVWVWEKLTNGETADLQNQFKAILDRPDLTVIMHVATADLPRIEKFSNTKLNGKLFDTKVAAKVSLRNVNSYGMAELISTLIDPRFSKDKAISTSQWDSNPEMWEDKAFEYAMNDVIYLHPLKERLSDVAERRGYSELLDGVMASLPAITRLYLHGFDERVLSY